MERIGATLRREREGRGLSLEEVSQRTKIQRPYLEAIERDDLGAVPAGPFLKGFIVSYARLVGISPEQVSALAPELDEVGTPVVPASLDADRRGPMIEIRDLSGSTSSGTRFFTGLSLTLALVIGAGLVWWQGPTVLVWLNTTLRPRPVAQAPRTGPQAAAPAGGNALSAPNAASGTRPSAGTSAAPGGTSVAPALPIATALVTPEREAPGEAGITAPLPSGDAPGKTSGAAAASGQAIQSLAPIESEHDHQVYAVYADPTLLKGKAQVIVLTARHRSYVRASATLEGAPVYEGVLAPGERKEFSTPSDLWLVLGNAGGLDISLNGRPLDPVGRDGERKGIAFRRPQGT